MSAHQDASGRASWNPAFRPDSLVDQVRRQSEAPAIIPDEVEEAATADEPVVRPDVDDFYQGHSGADRKDTPPATQAHSEQDGAIDAATAQPEPPLQDAHDSHMSESATMSSDQVEADTTDEHHPAPPVAAEDDSHHHFQEKDHPTQAPADVEPRGQIPEPHELYHLVPGNVATSAPATHQSQVSEREQAESQSHTQEQSPSAEHVDHEEAEKDALHRLPEAEAQAIAPEPDHDPLNTARQSPIEAVVTSHEQPSLHDMSVSEESAEIESAGIEYEYQGETNAADAAVREDAEASLLDDEEVMPTAQDNAAPPTPAADTANKYQQPFAPDQQQETQPKPSIDFGWQDGEEDSTFDDLGIQSQSAQPPSDAFWGETESDNTSDALGISMPDDRPQQPDQHKHQHSHQPSDPRYDQLQDLSQSQERPRAPQQDIIAQEPSAALFDDVEADDTFEALAAQATTPQQQPEEWIPHTDKHTYKTEDGPVAASQATALDEVLQELRDDEGVADTNAKPQEDDLAAMWSAVLDDDELLDDTDPVDPSGFFADDDEGFLEDFDASQPNILSPTQPVPIVDSQGVTQGFTAASHLTGQGGASRYTPAQTQPSREFQPNSMASPEFFSSPGMPALAASAPSMYGAYGQSPYLGAAPSIAQRPAGPQSSQSFVAKSKGGYASPYDLPEDIVQPRTRAPRHAAAPVVQAPAPPPRTSSMAPVPSPLSRAQTTSVTSPPLPSSSQPTPSLPPQPRSTTPGRQDSSGFFAELPVIPKLRSRPSGVYTPAPAAASTPSVLQAPPTRPGTMPPLSAAPQLSTPAQLYGGLQAPDRLPLLPNDVAPAPQQLQPPPIVPPANGRYSPAAPVTSAVLAAPPASSARFSPAPPSAPTPAVSRYSPAPVSQPAGQPTNKYAAAPQASRPTMPFAPRTSSPLAFAEKHQPENRGPQVRSVSYQPGPAPAPAAAARPPASIGPPSRRGSEQAEYGTPLHQVQSRTFAPPSRAESYQDMVASPPHAAPYAPSISASPESHRSQPAQPYTPAEYGAPNNNVFTPPRRSHTQSPGAVMKGPLRTMTNIDRPTSAAGPASPTVVRQQDTRHALHPARRQFSADLTYAPPQDERAADGLERWKGSPIIRWSPSGALVTSFPKQAPFYAVGHAIPTIKCSAGPITIHDSRVTFPMDERNAKFPGPFSLKGKGKKKEVLAWTTGKIEDLTKAYEEAMLDFDTPQSFKRRLEEKVVLWKMMKLFLENDNKVEGVATAEAEARNILLPNLAKGVEVSDEVTGAGPGLQQEPVSTNALAQIRSRLLNGKREDAVWYATEQMLWSHALLIASVSGPDLWKQVVQEFVRAQVKDAGENSQSLAALYEVFAGNWDESIDELVPPSARAGFQMISKSGPSAKNPLDGLDQWRETLGLIISNRSSNDVQAIAALGKLLSKYGRVEAAHTCFLFARASAKWGGADETTSDFVLLGADHEAQSQVLALDLDAILLTELYEYLLSLNPTPGASLVHPHLQSYKLHHAFTLAEHGLRNEAHAYCDSIVAAVKSSTRASPYYHAGLMSQVDDLSRCLSAAPQPTGSSWISKPSIDKVSGSMWKRFNTFVAGDEDEKSADGSIAGTEGQAAAAGPFGRVTGDTPSVSRSGSVTDLYGAMALHGSGSTQSAISSSSSAPSKYAPINAAAGRVPPEHATPNRYAPPTANTYSPRGSQESIRHDQQERPDTGYSMYTGLQPQQPTQRSSSTPFGAYLPQGQQSAEVPPAPQGGLGVPRPEVNRAVSDYRVPYSQPTSRRESAQSGPASGYSPRPSVEQSRYSPRPSIEQSQSSYGQQSHPPARVESPYQPVRAYTPSALAYGDDNGDEPQSQLYQSYEPAAQQSPYHPEQSTSTYDSPHASYEPPQASYAPPASSYESPAPSYEPPAPSYEPPASYSPPHGSYAPPGSSYESPAPSYEPPTPSQELSASSYEPPASSYDPLASGYEPPSSYAPPEANAEPSYEAESGPSSSYAPPTASYQPSSSYEPPYSSYQPYEPELDPEDQSTEAPAPKKNSVMDLDDDDDELAARAAALKAQQKREADAQADAAFRAAAEADAARDNASPSQNNGKKGWFGGWFKKGEGDLNQPGAQAGQPNKPIRAKLGEENSFYYDADLKKWINKKGGATPETGAGAGTPPPPRATPSRTASGLAPPPGPPSRVPSSGNLPPMGAGSGPPSRVSTPGGGAPPLTSPPVPGGVASAVPPGLASGPPSRPPTSMSNASSIDDLLGAPAPRKSGAGGKKPKRGGRYVDVMAK